jgi:methyl-accepting chemotaxis protein
VDAAIHPNLRPRIEQQHDREPALTRSDEQREKDLVTIRLGSRRRRWALPVLGAVVWVASFIGAAPLSPLPVIAVIVGGLLISETLTQYSLERGRYQPWLRYVFASLDVLLISAAPFALDYGSFSVVYFLAIIPYSFDESPKLGRFTAALSVVCLVLARVAHAQLPGNDGVSPTLLLDAILLLGSSLLVVPIASALVARVHRTRECMLAARQGDLTVTARGRHNDELGFMERDLNRLLGQLATIVAATRQESLDAARLSESIAAATGHVRSAEGELAGTTTDISARIESQREHTANGSRHAKQAAVHSGELKQRAEHIESAAQALVSEAESSRDSIGRAAAALMRVSERVRTAATAVGTLSRSSDQIDEFVETVSNIARQTNLLALNAAIEASRAGEHGRGFAVVAEEVRKLAEQSGVAAKETAGMVATVRETIDSVVGAMNEGEREVRDVGGVAAAAQGALESMVSSIDRIASGVAAAAAVSRSQSGAMNELSAALAQIDSAAAELGAKAESFARSGAQQNAAFDMVVAASQQMAQLSERLRQSGERFRLPVLPDQPLASDDKAPAPAIFSLDQSAATFASRTAPAQTSPYEIARVAPTRRRRAGASKASAKAGSR